MNADEPVDLDELAAWIREQIPVAPDHMASAVIGPSDLQRPPWRLTFNGACSALEALQARGDLVKGSGLAWRPAPAPQKPGKGYALPLSGKEHAALLRLLDWKLNGRPPLPAPPMEIGDTDTLRAIRSRLKQP